jgi:D-aminopeptidase
VIGITNTHSVGVVRDALVAHAAAENAGQGVYWSLPVVGETYDGALNDIDGQHVRREHVDAALDAASREVAEGNVGGGTGMILHEFKGGIGTASRRVPATDGGWTVGALVQANYGSRELLRVDGVPVGAAIPVSEVPSAWDEVEARDPAVSDAQPGMAGRQGPGGGSIIVVIGTDAPLLPHQCERIAQRAGLGLARMGSIASNGSGDLFIAFATGNRGLGPLGSERDPRRTVEARMVVDKAMSPLFQATVEAVEAAVVNALLAADTMTGRDGVTAYAIDHERLLDIMARYGRGPRAAG